MEIDSFEVSEVDDKKIIKIEPEVMYNEPGIRIGQRSKNLICDLKSENCSSNATSPKSCSQSRSSRLASKTSIVTSEVNNIYAKPRMHFTGKGIVTKTQPGCSLILKKKRGRKAKLKDKIKDVEASVTNQEIIVGVDSSAQNNTQEIKVEVEVNSTPESESYFYIKKKRDRRFAKVPDSNDSHIHPNYYVDINNIEQTELSINEEQFSENHNKRGNNSSSGFFNIKMFKRVGHHSDGLVECTVCFKQMKDTSMKQHFKTHSGAKPFLCSFCGARFTRKGDVERHSKTIHRSVKPFECSMCERRFVERKSLISHLQNHDRLLYYTCTSCGFKFGKREYYENHIRFIHPLSDGQRLTEVKDIVEKGLKQLDKLMTEEKEEAKSGKKQFCGEDLENMKDEISLDIKLEEVKEEENWVSSDESRMDPLTPESGICQENIEEEDEEEEEVGHLEASETPVSVEDVSVVKGTLSLSQTVPSKRTFQSQEEEQLVNKAIYAAISQAEVVLENIQSTVGNNMTSSESRVKISKQNPSSCADTQSCDKLSTPVQPKSSEIHINATVGGNLRKFIVQIPNGSSIDATTQEGMDTLVNMVNDLCSGKGELNGPVEVIMHHTV